MDNIFDVLIVGAGITGVMLAHKLARYKVRVAVLEAGNDVASGATRANSAIVHVGFDAACGTLKAKMNVKGCRELPEIAKQLDVAYENNTSLVVGYGDEDEEKLRELLERGRENGVPGLEIIGRERLHAMEPRLGEEASVALFAPTAGIVCPYGLAIGCAENAAVNGCEFFFGFRVDAIEVDGEGVTARSGERAVKGRYVANCAGIYSDVVARMIEPDFPVTLAPRRGEYMVLDKNEGKTCSATIFTVPGKEGKGILVSPTVDGNLIVGPNAHEVDRDDTATTADGLAEISAKARRIVPDINLRAVITSFAGIRATPSTGDFYVEASAKAPNFINLVGIESPGLASSPAVADYAIEKLAAAGLKLEERDDYNPFRTPDGHRQKLFRDLNDAEKQALCVREPAYGKVICRCETITEGDILSAIRRPLGARTLDMVKLRVRAGMGRCQGGFCSPRVAELLASEWGIPLDEVTKRGSDSFLLTGKTK